MRCPSGCFDERQSRPALINAGDVRHMPGLRHEGRAMCSDLPDHEGGYGKPMVWGGADASHLSEAVADATGARTDGFHDWASLMADVCRRVAERAVIVDAAEGLPSTDIRSCVRQPSGPRRRGR
jgi:hypothetical protein